MDALLEYQHVNFVRSRNPILNDINWQTFEGEHWVILGPNGAGKTTMAAIAAARSYPSSGQVDILGCRLGRTPVAELHDRVGLCSSAILKNIPPGQKVGKLILAAAWGTLVEVRGQIYEDQDYQRHLDLMRIFGVDQLVDRELYTLSDGERQRVLICRSLMSDPEILILDEPVAGVDLAARELLISALDELTSDPSCPQIIMVTHHLEEIPASFNKALMLNKGQIVAQGAIDDVITSENLAETYELPLQVGRTEDGRWWGHA